MTTIFSLFSKVSLSTLTFLTKRHLFLINTKDEKEKIANIIKKISKIFSDLLCFIFVSIFKIYKGFLTFDIPSLIKITFLFKILSKFITSETYFSLELIKEKVSAMSSDIEYFAYSEKKPLVLLSFARLYASGFAELPE